MQSLLKKNHTLFKDRFRNYITLSIYFLLTLLFFIQDTTLIFARQRRNRDIFTIKNDHLLITCNKKTGTFNFHADLQKFWDVTASALINRDKLISISDEGNREVRIQDNTITLVHEGEVKLEVKVRLAPFEPHAYIQLILENTTSNPISIERLIPFQSNGNHTFGSALRILKNYFYSWGLSSVISNDKPDFPLVYSLDPSQPLQRYSTIGNYISDMMMVIRDSDGSQQLTLGFLTHNHMLNHIRLWDDRMIIATCEGDGITLDPNQTIRAEELYFDIQTGLEPIERYAEITGNRMGARMKKTMLVGWSSWYQYFEKINEEVLLNNLEIFKNKKSEIPIQFFEIDDGYQLDNRISGRPGLGDWLVTNNNFPHGMHWLADTIRQFGLQPALWIAPFLIGENSDFYKNHPECIIRDAEGNAISVLPPWRGDRVYALDCTHPVSQEWLRNLFSTIKNQWGITIINADFLFAAARSGIHYQKNVTRAEAYRTGLKIIRNTLGPDGFLIAGGAPIGPSIGLVDAMRIGPDVSPWRWEETLNRSGGPGMTNAIRNTIGRYYMHKHFWYNFPDCFMLRNSEIELSEAEIRSWITLIGLTNGLLVQSDAIDLVPPERQEYLQRFFPYYSKTAKPLDFWDTEYPTQLHLEVNTSFDHYHVVGIFNWDNEDNSFTFPLSKIGISPDKECHVFEFWARKYYGKVRETIELTEIPMRACKLLIIREVQNKPQLIATGIHFTEGGVEVENLEINETSMRINLRSPYSTETKALFAVPWQNDIIERIIPVGKDFIVTFSR